MGSISREVVRVAQLQLTSTTITMYCARALCVVVVLLVVGSHCLPQGQPQGRRVGKPLSQKSIDDFTEDDLKYLTENEDAVRTFVTCLVPKKCKNRRAAQLVREVRNMKRKVKNEQSDAKLNSSRRLITKAASIISNKWPKLYREAFPEIASLIMHQNWSSALLLLQPISFCSTARAKRVVSHELLDSKSGCSSYKLLFINFVRIYSLYS